MAFLMAVVFRSGSGWAEILDRGCRKVLYARPLQLVCLPTTFNQHSGLQNRTPLHTPIGYKPPYIPAGNSRQTCLSC